MFNIKKTPWQLTMGDPNGTKPKIDSNHFFALNSFFNYGPNNRDYFLAFGLVLVK